MEPFTPSMSRSAARRGMRIDDLALSSSAQFSEDGTYRYVLERVFREGERKLVFIMLNPSTADASVGDPTIRRCMAWAWDWGYDRLTVLNLFALRSTDPKALYTHPDPYGPENGDYIDAHCDPDASCWKPDVICAWGDHGALNYRGEAVLSSLLGIGQTAWALRMNASGQPSHPLYIPANIQPFPIRRSRP